VNAAAAREARIRLAGQRQAALALARQRLMIGLLLFLGVLAVIALRLFDLAVLQDRSSHAPVDPFAALVPPRADIVDRNGVPLATTFDAYAVTVRPNQLVGDPRKLASELAILLPGTSEAVIYKTLKSGRRFAFLKRRVLPETAHAINALGEPAIALERETERLYPQTTLAAHVLGFTDIDGHGRGGMERAEDERLIRQDMRDKPLVLSIDSRVQQAMEGELGAAMTRFSALGAAGVVLDVRSGEVIAMTSLPSFNPNDPAGATPEQMFNRATLGVYELGSTFKTLTLAMGMDLGVIRSMGQRYDATAPLHIGRFRINDDHPLGRWLSIPEIFIHSSNIGTARIADEIGMERQRAYLQKLGFMAPVDIELKERGRTLTPNPWGRAAVLTVGYGHGMAVTPLHLATAYAAVVNGGVWRPATLEKRDPSRIPEGRRVFSQATSDQMRSLMRLVVLDGTGRKADAPGYRVGGKTGTAEKARAGGYARHSLVTTFAGAFPMDDPRYVVIAMLDEPKGTKETYGFATAGWNTAPVVSKVVSRIGPILGVVPNERKDTNWAPLMQYVLQDKKGN
jgi:cell division protein FtsI (penicillin-binding protein 3)